MERFNFKKKYGQNFLRDVNVLEKIVNNVKVSHNDLIIEIGPGDGALTKKLKLLGSKVLAYEIDETLKNRLDNLKDDNFDYILADFLERDIKSDLSNYKYDNLILVANLPYYITTPILEKVMELDIFKEVIIMVQDEVAKRLCALPKNKEYGAFTVLLDYYFQKEYLFFVNRKSFFPEPNVDSAVIKLTRKTELYDDFKKLKRIVFEAFQFKRKNLRNNLKKHDLVKIENVLKEYNLDLNNRAEDVPLECFLKLSEISD